jgi:hypothetical protein
MSEETRLIDAAVGVAGQTSSEVQVMGSSGVAATLGRRLERTFPPLVLSSQRREMVIQRDSLCWMLFFVENFGNLFDMSIFCSQLDYCATAT